MSFCEPRFIKTSYLGFPIWITDREVTITAPDGRRVGTTTSMRKARLIVKGYRKAHQA